MALTNLANLSNIASIIRSSGAAAILNGKFWYIFETGGINPQTRQAMETGGSYEKTRADLT